MRRVGIAVLAATAALAAPGLLLAEGPRDKPPPSSAHGKPPRPDRAPKKSAPSAGWVGAVDAVCEGGIASRRALMAEVTANPSPTARDTLVRILAGTTQIESRMLSRLAVIQPPSRDRAAFNRALRLFRVRHTADERLTAKLKRHWNAGLLQRQTRRDRLLNTRLARLWSALGATACASYFRSL